MLSGPILLHPLGLVESFVPELAISLRRAEDSMPGGTGAPASTAGVGAGSRLTHV